ncbi:uncharacterized protein B0P05DRAFT_547853 [Gilbertella persicaria]|uniref:uncharacterized protein n=1 Tax=Gilbertella persicaria TaxID=101096 RepID=UPI00221F3617|nr:uncharacterized protein B0P05DRAFT_547853 [Gilbertella persicaria]KAI8074247.1 hypothetical protein B0P05DRAFT_547853 [Gilbertella persicaria]
MGQNMSFKLACVFIVLVGLLQVITAAPMTINKRSTGAAGGVAGLVQDATAAAAGFNEGLTSSSEQNKGGSGGQGAGQDNQGGQGGGGGKGKPKDQEEDPEEEDPSDDQGEEKDKGKKKNKQSDREMQAVATGENAKKSASNFRSGIMSLFS